MSAGNRNARRRPSTAAVAAILLGALLPAPPTGAVDPFFARWKTSGKAQGLPSDKVFAVAVDGSAVWAGTEDGLARLKDGTIKVFRTSDGLPSAVISALAVDPVTGDVWVGTMGGLARISAGRIDAFNQLNSGLANNVVYGVAVQGEEVWIATAAGLSRYRPKRNTWEIFDTSNTLMHEPWCYSVTTAERFVYVGVWGGGVIVRDPVTGRFRDHRDPDGEVEIDLFRDDGLVHDVVSSVSLANGVMWVGTYFGLSRYDGRRWNSYSQEDSGLAGDFVNFVKARDEVVWIGTDQGLSRFDSKTWHTWRRREDGSGLDLHVTGPEEGTHSSRLSAGPASNTIYGIDLDGGGIWLATAAGLSRGIARTEQGE